MNRLTRAIQDSQNMKTLFVVERGSKKEQFELQDFIGITEYDYLKGALNKRWNVEKDHPLWADESRFNEIGISSRPSLSMRFFAIKGGNIVEISDGFKIASSSSPFTWNSSQMTCEIMEWEWFTPEPVKYHPKKWVDLPEEDQFGEFRRQREVEDTTVLKYYNPPPEGRSKSKGIFEIMCIIDSKYCTRK